MTILVDIDGVLACNNVPQLLALYVKSLKLPISDEQLAQVKTKEVFHLLPEVQAYIENVGLGRYQSQLARLQWHPGYVMQCLLIRGASEGVKYLAGKADELGYCTARMISFHDEWNRDLARATHMWLRKQQLPNSDQVLFCDGFKAKLMAIVTYLREHSGAHVLLIDDSANDLLLAYTQLDVNDQHILQNGLTLVAFGYDESVDHPVQVVPLADWTRVGDLEKEFDHALVGKE